MAAGPVLLLILWITGQDVGGWWGMLAGVLFVGGFVALVSRLKEDRDEDDDDPQSGAVV
jgi:predicted PurR-regulated permease PerM